MGQVTELYEKVFSAVYPLLFYFMYMIFTFGGYYRSIGIDGYENIEEF